LLIIDGAVAFTGGMNIQQKHLPGPDGIAPITDLQFKLDGALAQQMDEVFLADWRFASGEVVTAAAARPGGGDMVGRVITEGPNEDLDRLVMVLIGAMSAAHQRIWIMTPYFLPTSPLLSALQSAALRGVEVSVILPQTSDQPWMDWAAHHMLWQLLERQVRIDLRPPPFAHTKLLIVDDWYVQFGSANLDQRSLRLNFELVIEAYNSGLARGMAAHFAEVRALCRPLTLQTLQARRFPARLRDAVCWLFSPYL
jgi:cardiolipin synthase